MRARKLTRRWMDAEGSQIAGKWIGWIDGMGGDVPHDAVAGFLKS